MKYEPQVYVHLGAEKKLLDCSKYFPRITDTIAAHGKLYSVRAVTHAVNDVDSAGHALDYGRELGTVEINIYTDEVK